MIETLTAVFEQGSFHPESPCDLPEGSRVILSIKPADKIAASGPQSSEERGEILKEVVERMMRNPLPPDAPRFRRSEMYDRG